MNKNNIIVKTARDIRSIFFDPATFFSKNNLSGRASIYHVALIHVISTTLFVVIAGLVSSLRPENQFDFLQFTNNFWELAAGFLAYILIIPLGMFIGLIAIYSFVLYLIVILNKGKPKFEKTFAITAYALTPVYIFPFGFFDSYSLVFRIGIIVFVYSQFLLTVGIKTAFKMSFFRAFLYVLSMFLIVTAFFGLLGASS